MRFTRPVTRQALRGGMVAVALSALVSGALNLPALAQGLEVVTDPNAPAFSAEQQAAVDALAAQLAGATSRNAVVSILQNSTLPKAQVRAAVQAAIATRGLASSVMTADGGDEGDLEYAEVTLESLPALRQQLVASRDTVKLRALDDSAKTIKTLQTARQRALDALEQARQAGDTSGVTRSQREIDFVDARIGNELTSISVALGAVGATRGGAPPPADPVAETLKTVLGLIDASTGGSDTRLTFVDTQNNSTRNTSTAAITQPSVASTLAQNATVTIYVG